MLQSEPTGNPGGDPAGLVVPSAPRSVGAVRRFAVDACAERGWQRSADVVALLVTEVATNAVLHADGSQISVRVVDVDRGTRLRVEVDDAGPERPSARMAPAHDEHGRGLALVDALAVRWGVAARNGGKTVWFEVGH